jgi:1-acyl-sn-glycerol-3-phosphate acyltransferase
MPERASYRFIIVGSQYVFWLVGQVLRLRYDIRAHRPAGIFEHEEHCLILSATHKTILDPWLLMIALDYRHFRTLVPIRVLATQTFVGQLSWLRVFKPLIKAMYRLAGVIELPPEDHGDDGFHGEKVRGLLVALKAGDVVAIFPEGEIWRRQEPPIGEFAPGVVYLQRKANASILPIAVWMSRQTSSRRRYVVQFGRRVKIPEDLDLESGAAWLREQVLELYEQAKREGEV